MSTSQDLSAVKSTTETRSSPADSIMKPPLLGFNQRSVGTDVSIDDGAIERQISFDSYCGRDVIVSGRTAMRRGIRGGASGSQHQPIGQGQRCYVFGNQPLQCGGK